MKVQSRSNNKKIGELVCDGAMKFVDNFAVEINGERVAEYKGLDAVAKDWKDYTPTEPLIEDRKTRKAIRAWAEAEGIESVAVMCHLVWGEKMTEIAKISNAKQKITFKGELGIKTGEYTITELCGEEQE